MHSIYIAYAFRHIFYNRRDREHSIFTAVDLLIYEILRQVRCAAYFDACYIYKIPCFLKVVIAFISVALISVYSVFIASAFSINRFHSLGTSKFWLFPLYSRPAIRNPSLKTIFGSIGNGKPIHPAFSVKVCSLLLLCLMFPYPGCL